MPSIDLAGIFTSCTAQASFLLVLSNLQAEKELQVLPVAPVLPVETCLQMESRKNVHLVKDLQGTKKVKNTRPLLVLSVVRCGVGYSGLCCLCCAAQAYKA